MGAHVCIRLFLVAALFVMPAASYAVWICHTEDGRSWQQDYPPCKLPADVSTLSPAPQRGRPAQATSRARQAQEPSAAPAAGSENISALYDRAVSELEAQYPVLNPDLPVFNGALTEQVLAQTETYVRQGYRKDYAVRAAAETVLAPRPSPTGTTPAAQTTPNTSKQLRGAGWIVDAFAKGALNGLFLTLLVPIFFAVRWLWRRTTNVAARAAYVAGNTSAADIARAAGSASANVQRRSAGLVEAFRQGQREAEKRTE